MIDAFPETYTEAIIQTKTVGSGITNGAWTDGLSVYGSFTLSAGTKTIINDTKTVTVNAQFHYEGERVLTERQRLKINGDAFEVIYSQQQLDLETGELVHVVSLKRLK